MIVPSFRYHKELAPDGQLFHSLKELEALDEQWVDSPAKFEVEVDSDDKHEDLALLEKEPAKRRGRKPKSEG